MAGIERLFCTSLRLDRRGRKAPADVVGNPGQRLLFVVATLAQLVEHGFRKAGVPSSILGGGSVIVISKILYNSSIMKIISKKNSVSFSWFLLIAGVGALWLTFWWFKLGFSNSSSHGGSFSGIAVLFYYIFNSLLLVFSAILLYSRRIRLHSILAILLGISVTGSLFIIQGSSIVNSLFISTAYLGMMAGTPYGGTLLVPLFLVGVYASAINALLYLQKKINYDDDQTESMAEGNTPMTPVQKGTLVKAIPVVTLFVGIFYAILYGPYVFTNHVQGPVILIALLPFIVIVLSVISLLSKRVMIYRILNIISIALVAFPVAYLWASQALAAF